MSLTNSISGALSNVVGSTETAASKGLSSLANAVGLGQGLLPTSNSGAAGKQFLKNNNYKAVIHSQAPLNLDLHFYLEEAIVFGVTANYSQPFAQALTGRDSVSNFMAMFGVIPLTQFLTTELWYGSSSIEFSLNFVLNAEASGQSDVTNQIQTLLSLVMPGQTKQGFLTTPGPYMGRKTNVPPNTAQNTVGSAIKGGAKQLGSAGVTVLSGQVYKGLQQAGTAVHTFQKTVRTVYGTVNKVSLSLGNFMMLPEVVVTSVNPTVRTLFDANGQPMYASVQVGFKTYRTPVIKDLARYFPG